LEEENEGLKGEKSQCTSRIDNL
jgi:hypothetical protein